MKVNLQNNITILPYKQNKQYMKKILLSFSLLAGLTFSTLAQQSALTLQQDPKIKVSIGGEYLYAIGNSAEYLNAGYGASIQGEYMVLPKFKVTASAAFVSLSPSKLYREIYEPWYGSKIPNSVYYPVKAGAKYYFLENFYAAAEAGATITTEENRTTSFVYVGGLGSSFEVSSKSSIDVGLRYETWALSAKSKDTFVGLRAAYCFGF